MQHNLGHRNSPIWWSLDYHFIPSPTSSPLWFPSLCLFAQSLSTLTPVSHLQHLSPAPVCVMHPQPCWRYDITQQDSPVYSRAHTRMIPVGSHLSVKVFGPLPRQAARSNPSGAFTQGFVWAATCRLSPLCWDWYGSTLWHSKQGGQM